VTNDELAALQAQLRDILSRTAAVASGENHFVEDVRINAAEASAHLAQAIAEIEEIVREGEPCLCQDS